MAKLRAGFRFAQDDIVLDEVGVYFECRSAWAGTVCGGFGLKSGHACSGKSADTGAPGLTRSERLAAVGGSFAVAAGGGVGFAAELSAGVFVCSGSSVELGSHLFVVRVSSKALFPGLH